MCKRIGVSSPPPPPRLVQGIVNDEDDESEDDGDATDEDEAAAQAKSDAYTEAQVAQLRHIVINKRRADVLEEMTEMVRRVLLNLLF